MTNANQHQVKAGQIRLDLIPIDWPLTPLGANKDPYVQGWQNKPFSVGDIEDELITGNCKAIGLLGGPVYNQPYGLIWVDVDGPSVHGLVEELSGLPFDQALPNTLTIFSGKEGRERKLYRLKKEKHKHFLRNKYIWHSTANKEKLEILWKRHQGVLMGSHPETDGYFTGEQSGFEWADKLPEMPDWILVGIITKNAKQGKPAQEISRVIGGNFAINTSIGLERDMKLAVDATWGMPPGAADDYDIWITVGQTLHALDDSLLNEWDEWSKQSEKYKEGECHKRWLSFNKNGGRGIGSLMHLAKEQGWVPPEDYKVLGVDDQTLDHISSQLDVIENNLKQQQEAMPLLQEEKVTIDTEEDFAYKKRKKKVKSEFGPKNEPHDVIADHVFSLYQGNLRYSEQQGSFYMYGHRSAGVWSHLSDIEIKASIKEKLEVIKASMLPNGYGMTLITDVVEQLRICCLHEDWYESNRFLLFTNGILNVETRELLPFDRGMYMTQQLPYAYDKNASCEPIIKWLKEAQNNNWGRVQVLRAWLRAVLLSHSEIQKFVEIVGPGKSGKSTYSNLAHALVGDENAMISSLEHLEKNRFETANLYKKKLLLFNDVERYGGSVSVLKAITGRDLIRKERKFQSGSQKPFKFNGLVIITANEPIQTTDPTSGLARRRLTIPFDKPFTGNSAQQRTLIDMDDNGKPFGEFASLLPGLVNWVLDMTEEEMREYLMETTTKVEFFAKHHREQILKSNQIMDWMEHCICFDPGVASAVGMAKMAPQGSGSVYANAHCWLYANYCEFSRASNNNILGRSRFETLLMDVCKHQLNLNVFKFKRSGKWMFSNVVCRAASPTKYENYPSIVEVGLNKKEWKEQYGNVLDNSTDETIEVDEETQWQMVGT